MATPYSMIHNIALTKISDYDILKYDYLLREEILDGYLFSAIVEVQRTCNIDLSDRNEEEKCFNENLSDEIIEILATGEAFYWLNPKVLNSEKLKNALNTKDYTIYSPANLLAQLHELRNTLWNDFRRMMIEYTYYHGNISMQEV